MNVAVDSHGALDNLALLKTANGNGEVVHHAEPFAVVGEGVMESAANVDARAVSYRALGSEDGAAGMQHEGIDYLRGVRDLHLQLFARGEAAFNQLVDVMRGVHQHHIGLGSGLGLEEVGVVNCSVLEEALADQAVLVGAKDVLADGEEVFLAVNQFERQHERWPVLQRSSIVHDPVTAE